MFLDEYRRAELNEAPQLVTAAVGFAPGDRLGRRTRIAALDFFAGRRRGWRTALSLAGPAALAATAYVDPGNLAVNLQAGAGYRYSLLWVVLAANLLAMLFQSLSAKLGIVTGHNLAELCREHFPRPVVQALWGLSELAAMATDLAEFLGGAIGLALLLHMPLLAGMTITAAVTAAILLMEGAGFRLSEIIAGGFVAAISLGLFVEVAGVPVNWHAAVAGIAVPRLADRGALAIAVGIVGATVMPHALFLHSGLTQRRIPIRTARERRLLVRFSHREVVVALGIAGAGNLAIIMLAAATMGGKAGAAVTIAAALPFLTPIAAGTLLVLLIASGIASSVAGTIAGQIVMEGFVGFRMPLWLRRLVTMLPAFAVVAFGVDAGQALVWSQIVLSLALPAAMVPLVLFTRRRDIMGPLANSGLTDAAAIAATALVLSLDLVFLVQSFA